LKTIAFPSISTGAYRYPIEYASQIALKTVKGFLENQNKIEEVVFVLFSESTFKIYSRNAEKLF